MATYTHEYSNFPDTIMDERSFKDVTGKVATLINKIKNFQAAGDYTSASTLISENPDIKEYIIDMEVINELIEQERNTEIYAKTIKQSTYIGKEPETPIHMDVWLEVGRG